MKRKLLQTDFPALHTSAKAGKFWITATDIKNYMINDPLVDWFKKYSRKPDQPNKHFSSFIMDRGNVFEKQVVEYISKNKFNIVFISPRITPESCQETISHMKNGTPIIHSAPFENPINNTRGVIDLLVRSDFLHVFAEENPLPADLTCFPAPNLTGKYHYLVIDIKFSTLPLRADGKHLLNSGNYPAYKAQLRIYTEAIGHIQGYTSRFAYILGRRWVYTSKGNNYNNLGCFNKLGTVDFEGVDEEYVHRTEQAIHWVRDVRENGHTWSVNPPSRPELFPNMCVDSGEWNNEKKTIADSISDITQIWYCGIKQRKKAMIHGIESWRDPRCTSAILGIGGERGKIVDQILDINRQDIYKILPQKLRTRIPIQNEIFVDFETFSDIFADLTNLPEQPRTDGIFMIGVYYNGRYKNFTVKESTDDEEYRIMDEFMKFMKDNNFPLIWYWHAEKMIWQKAEDRQLKRFELDTEQSENIINNWRLRKWADLCNIFKTEPIVIKDCLKFGLKNVAEAMRKHGMITAQLQSECQNGFEASIKAWQIYQTEKNPENHPTLLDIVKYNEFDVQVLDEILAFLRKNMT